MNIKSLKTNYIKTAQRLFTLLVITVMLFQIPAPNSLLAGSPGKDGDILVHLRLYEGSRGNEIQESSVVSTYVLKPLFVSNMLSEIKLEEEKNELKRIFNLNHINLMTQTSLGMKEAESEKRFQMIVLNGHEFLIQLTMKGQKDNFKVEVLEKGTKNNDSKIEKKDQSLLETNLVLPQKKSTIFGFEDSLRKPYFICLQREENQPIIDKEPLQIAYDESRLLRRIPPKYPKNALEKKIEGPVVMDAVLDKYGRVVMAKVISGKKELRFAAINAIKQWQFEPYIVEGKAMPTRFSIIVNFTLPTQTSDKPGKHYTGVPMSFNFSEAALNDVLRIVAKIAKINIVVDPGIDCKISSNLTDTPWDKALKLMLNVNNLDMIKKGNVLRIVKATPWNKKVSIETEKAVYIGEPQTFKFKNADLVTVIEEIAKKRKLKVVLEPGIKGKVSTHMVDVPWDQFFDLILQINGLEQKRKGDTIHISKVKTGIPAKQSPNDKKNRYLPSIYPTKGYLCDAFGMRTHPVTGKRSHHNGLDIAAKIGTKVVAPADGTVIIAEQRNYYGKLIIIDHGFGYTTRYGHLDSLAVKVGDQVKRGQKIGTVGNTGRTQVPHLHYEIRYFGKPQNPQDFLK